MSDKLRGGTTIGGHRAHHDGNQVNLGPTIASARTRLGVDSLTGDYLPLSGGTLTGQLNVPKIQLNTNGNPASGYSYYQNSYTPWQTYMANAGATKRGYKGNLTPPTGTLVSSWAIRSLVEGQAGYGWTFEAATGVNATGHKIQAEISSSSGEAWFRGDITAFSDIRVKSNLEVIQNPISKVQQLNGYTFNRIDGLDGRYAGLIAQEVQEVLPEVVKTGPDGMLSVAYGNTVALLIEAIKEQQKQIEELQLLVKGKGDL